MALNEGKIASALTGRNLSPQVGVEPNPDPVTDTANEHQQGQQHHVASAKLNKEQGIVNAKDLEPNHDLMGYEGDREGRLTGGGLGRTEPGSVGSIRPTRWKLRRLYDNYTAFFHLSLWAVWTAWWIYGLVFHRHDHLGWLKPTLLYIGITLRIVTLWVPVTPIVLRMAQFVWGHTVHRVYAAVPEKLRQPLAAVGTVAVFLVGTMVPKESGQNTRTNRAISMFGLVVMIAVLYGTSRNRRRVLWHTVIGGMLTQFIMAVFVLRTKTGYDIFNFVSYLARTLLGFADQGVVFLTAPSVVELHWFLTSVVPPIIFFVALVQLLYHAGLLQWFIGKVAVFFFWTLRVSGAEAVVAAATPFIGQGESAMLVRPFISHLTLAEIHQVMTCGFATISGSVLVSYVALGLNPQALVSSCIMSIPASLAISKLRYPETEETLTSGRVVVPEDPGSRSVNALQAFANGAWMGIRIAGMIVATLLCIIAFVGLVNGFLIWWGRYWGIDDPPLTLQLILGYVLYPVSWLLGVPKQDLRLVGELIGTKIIVNEYAAFALLTGDDKYSGLTERAKLIATYACCGFGNIGSLGTQIGVLTQLAPCRTADFSKVALSALFSGVLATLTSASIAGMLFTEGMSGV